MPHAAATTTIEHAPSANRSNAGCHSEAAPGTARDVRYGTPVPLWARLVALAPAFGIACLVSPIPTLAVPDFARMGAAGAAVEGAVEIGNLLGVTTGIQTLLLLPLLSFFTVIFAGPFAAIALLWLAIADRRGVGLHVLCGMAVTLPAMVWFQLVMQALSPPVVVAIVLGGAIGGLTAHSARLGAQDYLVRWARGETSPIVSLRGLARWAARLSRRASPPSRRGSQLVDGHGARRHEVPTRPETQ